MPITPGLTVAADSGRNDAFGRMRTSEPRTLFSSTHVVTDGADFWQTITAGGATSTHLPDAAMTWREVY